MAMSSVGFDHQSNDYLSQPPRGFLTPPPAWKNNRCSPATTRSEKKPRRTTPEAKGDLFHVVHKIPSGDSPYVRAKHVQLVDKDPSRAVSLFWAAINSGDRVDSALKDMAVVMKQLDRSDEAIEAIKSFRHLSSLESQESLDNILLELYKHSGRMEEEIEMLRRKLKQVEEGLAFCGRRTKVARSQGKKVQIPIEKEYSRLLGNLAWAYMQQNDFKSAEENYRKALSFEPDKNKQCNLAICLMHMNKLTEAKFLLQAVCGNGNLDESYAKSYERASEILAEFESSQKQANGMLSSPPPLSVKTNNGPFTGYPYEKRADFDWRSAHKRPRDIPKVPFTQPRRSGDQRTGGVDGSYCRKLSFGSFTGSFVNENVNYYSTASSSSSSPNEMMMPKVIPQFCVKPLEAANENECCVADAAEDKENRHKKSWADMVEEDEQEFEYGKNDENVDPLCERMDFIDLGRGYLTQPEKTSASTNQPVRRSLCFDQNQNQDQDHPNMPQDDGDLSPLMTQVLSFDSQVGGGLSEDLSSGGNRRRLQVFRDITGMPESPRQP